MTTQIQFIGLALVWGDHRYWYDVREDAARNPRFSTTMAEGGGGNENDNPFTYQTFVTNRGCTGADDSERTVENNKETGDATSTSACTKLTVNPISTSSDVQNRDQHCHAHCQSQTSQTQSQTQTSQSQTQTSQSQSRSQSYTSHDRHGADLGLASGSASASSASGKLSIHADRCR